jgi:thiosulfate/3-mercaptopyruvate sulfurtransferase
VKHTSLIDAAALAKQLESPNLALIDCRFDLAAPAAGAAAYLAGHIPGAVYAHLETDLSDRPGPGTGRHPLPSPARLAQRLGAMGVDANSQIVAYDAANGSMAARLWWLARWLGLRHVAVLNGGFSAWVAAGGAVQAGDAQPRGRSFAPSIDAAAAVTTAGVMNALQDPRLRLVDARAEERYAGTVEPIDARAGHVPGALNYPFMRNLTADGRFHPAAELRRRWLEFLAGTRPQDVIAMCGSGVTACHNLLALEAAGLPGARLYAGSWSEWIADPRRAVATGTAAGAISQREAT